MGRQGERKLSAFGFLLMVFYIPGILDAATEPRWILIFVTMAIIVCFRYITRITVGHFLGMLILSYAALSMTWSLSGYDATLAMARLLTLALVFCVGAETTDIRPLLKGLAAGASVNSAIVLVQWGWPHSLQHLIAENNSPAGLFIQGNCLPEATALIVVGLLGYRLWWYIPGTLPALLMQGSRGALGSLALCGLVWLWGKTRLGALILGLAMGLVGLSMVGSGAHHNSFEQRAAMWDATVRGITIVGNGIGSFYSTFPLQHPRINLVQHRPDHAHNDMMELTYELGVGIIFVVVFLAFAFAGTLRSERAILLTFVLEGITGFPLYFPATAFLALFCAGRLCGERIAVRDFVARCGISLHAWRTRWHAQGQVRALFSGSTALSSQSLLSHRAGLLRHGRPISGLTSNPYRRAGMDEPDQSELARHHAQPVDRVHGNGG